MQFVDKVPQPVINLGYGLAAKFLGETYSQYRAITSESPISDVNLLQHLNFVFDQDPTFSHKKPKGFGDPFYWGCFDATQLQAGDYFTDGGQHTFFCCNFEPLRPPMLIRCNRVINLLRPSSPAGGYGGDIQPISILSGWPVAIIQNGMSGPNISATPGSVSDPGVTVYLPDYAEIETYDIIEDDVGRRYVVAQNELTPLGYRLVARFETV